jgi:hypothetical protein
MGKLYVLQDLLEPRDLPSFNAVKITRQKARARTDESFLKIRWTFMVSWWYGLEIVLDLYGLALARALVTAPSKS